MASFGSKTYTVLAAVLAVSSLSSHQAYAQAPCFLLSGSARTLCNEAAARSAASRKKPADTPSSTPTAAPPAPVTAQQPVSIPSTVATSAPPAQDMQRFEVAKGGGLSVDISGSYPQGFAPAWAISATTPQAITTNRYNIHNHGPQGTETLFVRITDDQGRAALEFSRRSTAPCLADIVGLPQVLTSAPQRFDLANFRYANNQGPQCQRTLGSTAPWKGSITLSADADGNIKLSLVLDLAMPSGAPWLEFTAQDLPFENRMTPQMALADLTKKNQEALASAARAKEAAIATAAREREAAEARAAFAARLAAMPLAGPVYSRQTAGYVATDSSGWAMNRLDPGSVHNVRVYSGTVKTGNFILRAEYTYNGGAAGWAVLQYNGGKFSCIQFWDSMIGCRALRRPGEGQAVFTSIISSAMSDSVSSGSGKFRDCIKNDSRDSNGQPIAGSGCAGQ